MTTGFFTSTRSVLVIKVYPAVLKLVSNLVSVLFPFQDICYSISSPFPPRILSLKQYWLIFQQNFCPHLAKRKKKKLLQLPPVEHFQFPQFPLNKMLTRITVILKVFSLAPYLRLE